MIYIERNKENPFQQETLYINQYQIMKEWTNDPQKPPQGWKSPSLLGNLHPLKAQFNCKCAYCETTFKDNQQGKFHYFRPKQLAKEDLSQNLTQEFQYYYHWLSWKWSNFYLACERCNFKKSSRFPIEKQQAKSMISDSKKLFDEEKPLLLDPCLDNPNEYLVFYENGTVVAKNECLRGSTTIDILGLNREELVTKRKEEANKLKTIFKDVIVKIYTSHKQSSNIQQKVDNLKLQCEADKSFAGMKRQLMFKWLKLLKNYLENYIRDYYKKLPQRLSKNSRVEKEVLISNLLMLTSLQTKKLPLNDLITNLQNWLNEPNNSSQIFTLDTEASSNQVPEWLKNLFLNEEKDIEMLDSIIEKFVELDKENPNIEDEETISYKLKTKLSDSELKIKYQNSDVYKLINAFIEGTLNMQKLPQATLIAALTIVEELADDNIFAKTFSAFIKALIDDDDTNLK